MKILGLTGSIGMGKSTAAAMLRRLGIPVHDADAAVHRLMGPGGRAVPAIKAVFPGVVIDGAVSRPLLGQLVFGDKVALKRLEAILHPLVRAEEAGFLRRQARARFPLVVLDIPLLFETGGDKRCDRVAVVTCPAFLQAERVLARPGMTPERLAAIRAQQMPDGLKRRRGDFLIRSGSGKGPALRALRRAVTLVLAQCGRGAWPPRPCPRFDHA
jgi:dephospho-CoA kinase